MEVAADLDIWTIPMVSILNSMDVITTTVKLSDISGQSDPRNMGADMQTMSQGMVTVS